MRRTTQKNLAFTLLEVVVGLVLLATVLVSSLLALGRHQRQLRLASDRDSAISIADKLLARWMDSSARVPISTSASLAERPGWIWRTEVASNRVVMGRNCVVVRLEIVDRSAASRPEVVLVSVETLQPPVLQSPVLKSPVLKSPVEVQ